MELDDLRRQWRQAGPVTEPAALGAAELTQLLARQSGSTIARLRRNARLEMLINYTLLPVSLALAGLASVGWVRIFGGLLALIALVCIFYFHRKLRLLRSMSDPAGDLRGHLLLLTSGLRALIRFYYRLTLAMVPVSCLLMGGMALSSTKAAVTPPRIWLIGALLVMLCIVMYLPVAHTTRRYLHWLYGQHLDRLEGQLRELDETNPTSQP
jgi:hypothetical protein